MQWIRQKGMYYLQFSQLARIPHLHHGIFFRFIQNRRRSTQPFNLGLGCGDRNAQVWERRHSIGNLFGFQTLVFARQVHGDQVKVWPVDADPQTRGTTCDRAFVSGDALATAKEGHALIIQTADCQSVLIVDPKTRTVANVHSGWRGSIANIIGRTVDTMVENFGCRAEDLCCGIGPSLGPCCAEFVNYRREIPEDLWEYKFSNDYFDFWRMSKDQLTHAGVRKENVENSHICTRCNQHLFFSYRGEGQTGRFASVIGFEN